MRWGNCRGRFCSGEALTGGSRTPPRAMARSDGSHHLHAERQETYRLRSFHASEEWWWPPHQEEVAGPSTSGCHSAWRGGAGACVPGKAAGVALTAPLISPPSREHATA